MKTIKTVSASDPSFSSVPESGLLLCGSVSQRSKRIVPVNNSTIEIVTYLIVDNSGRFYYVDDYSPNQYYEVGQSIRVSVYVKPYRKKNGEASYSLNFLKPYRPSTKGEVF
ncbi:MAG: hypothetical protein J6A79_01735 [Clostridia bacterium]|nr:hypothetical protein [Clostridia bacterium]